MNTILQQRGNKKKKGQDKEECTLSSCFRRPEPSDCLTHRPRCFSSFSVLQYLQCPGGWNDSKKKACTFFLIQVQEGMLKTQTNGTRLYCFDHRIIFGISFAVLGCFSWPQWIGISHACVIIYHKQTKGNNSTTCFNQKIDNNHIPSPHDCK